MNADFGELSVRVLNDGPGALTLDEACWLIAKANEIPELLADRDEGWRQHNKAVCALAALMSEFRVIEKEFTRMKRAYEPPYVSYASYAMPEAIRVAKAASKRPEVAGDSPGAVADFDVTETLRKAAAAASVVHDYICSERGVTFEQASEAVWAIHDALRPLFEEADLGY